MERVHKENIFIEDVKINSYIGVFYEKYTSNKHSCSSDIYFLYSPYYYNGLDVDLIGYDVSEIDNRIGIDKLVYIEGKGIIGYPYKKYEHGCGMGYSLTMYSTANHKIAKILNELSFYCNDRKLISKTQIIDEHKNYYENIFIWPFINFKR